MSLRQFAQELQSIQTSQDQTIAWMRDRIDQMAEVGAPRDVITSPPLGQAGVVPSKRKADYSTNDQHEWSRRGPAEHQQHPGQQNYPAQGSGSMSSSTLVPPPQQQQQPSGQGSGGRYEASSFHPSFHPVHHPSQPQHPAVASQQPSQAPPPPVQQQQQQQRQHPSPPMNANAPHYQKGAVNSVLHD
ncbi:hypothetical protein EDD11_007980 [Mortierella claussenii]|nr:hypothetical protein EDD11_007980 [Mortierella claussenii]